MPQEDSAHSDLCKPTHLLGEEIILQDLKTSTLRGNTTPPTHPPGWITPLYQWTPQRGPEPPPTREEDTWGEGEEDKGLTAM